MSVAALCAHDKPWVRTMARRVVRAVLTDPVTSMENGLHAAASGVGMFVQQQLQTAVGECVFFFDQFSFQYAPSLF